MNGPFGYILIAAAAFAADLFVKNQMAARLETHVPYEVLPFLAFYLTHNTGIAFSMLHWLEGPWLIVLPLVIIGFVLWLAIRTPPAHVIARIGFALVIGGAIGNLYDRVAHGHVVDYILFFVGGWSFAIFNLADVFITVGAGLVLVQELIEWRKGRAGSGS